MKKFKLGISDLKEIKDYFNENASEASSKIIELIKRLEEAEVEIDEKTLYEEIKTYFEETNPVDEKMEEKIAEEVANAFSKLNKQETKMEKKEVKNEFTKAVMGARNRDEALKAVKDFEVKNGISFTSGNFETPKVDYDIKNEWFEGDELFNALNQTEISKFFYTTQDWDDTYAKAAAWTKGSTDEKAIQALTLTPKVINTGYIYKRQRYAQEDLDDINDAGKLSQFLDWTTAELRRHVIDMVVAGVIGTKSVTNIEGITTSNSAFTTVKAVTGASAQDMSHITLDNVREIVDAVRGQGERWLVINRKDLTRLAKHIYASGGTSDYMTKEEVAMQVGADRIYVTDLQTEGRVVCFIPSEYFIKIKNTLNVAYPQWELNAQNMQFEMNIGGAIHGLLSSSLLYNNYGE